MVEGLIASGVIPAICINGDAAVVPNAAPAKTRVELKGGDESKHQKLDDIIVPTRFASP